MPVSGRLSGAFAPVAEALAICSPCELVKALEKKLHG